jgi:hypothetical protein
MAAHKPTRPNSSAQLSRRRPNPYLKQELFANLRELNRGFGIALAALTHLPQPQIFPAACVRDYRNRTESLRALANRDLLRLLAGHEDQDAARFAKESPARRTRASK